MNNFHKTKIAEYIKDVWGRIEWKKLKDIIKGFILTSEFVVISCMLGVTLLTFLIVISFAERYKDKLKSTVYEVYENGEYIKDVREFDFTITDDCVHVQQDWYCPQVTLKFKYKKGEK